MLMSCSQDETIKFWHLPTGKCQKTVGILRPYEEMNIQDIQGLSAAQMTMLKFLGAIEVGDSLQDAKAERSPTITLQTSVPKVRL
jgi:hypothetical protein